jgi:hypothetical protein
VEALTLEKINVVLVEHAINDEIDDVNAWASIVTANLLLLARRQPN